MRAQSILLLSVVACILAFLPAACFAQSQPTNATPQPAAEISTPQTAPAQPPAATPPATGTKAKPAKVWTNDEVRTLHSDQGISEFASPGSRTVSTTAKPTYAQEKDPAWYRSQIETLQTQIENVDDQIATLRANGVKPVEGPVMYPPRPSPQLEKLKQLQAKRARIEAKIEDLFDSARHNDIPPGELR